MDSIHITKAESGCIGARPNSVRKAVGGGARISVAVLQVRICLGSDIIHRSMPASGGGDGTAFQEER